MLDGSARLFGLSFHHCCSEIELNRSFGGLQIVAVEDSLQLKPVCDNFDHDAMMSH